MYRKELNSQNKDAVQTEKLGLVTLTLGLYFCLMPFDSFTIMGAGTLLRFASLLPIGAVLLQRKLIFRLDKMSLAVLVYLASITVTCFYSMYPDVSWNGVRRVLLNVGLLLFVGSLCLNYNDREIKFLKRCLVIGGFATLFLTFVFGDRSMGGRLTISVNGSIQDQNYLNGYLFFAYIYCLTEFLEKKKPFYSLGVLLILYFNLLTGSRGALLAYVAITGFTLLTLMKRSGKLKISYILAGIVVLVILILNYDTILSFLPESVAERFSIEYIKKNGSTGRVIIWKTLLTQFVQAGTFRTVFGFGYATTAYLNYYNYMPAHNVLVDHIVMGGIMGLLIYVIYQGVYVYQAIKSKDLFLSAAYIGYLTMMMSLSLWTYKPIWNLMMMILIISHRNRKTSFKEM